MEKFHIPNNPPKTIMKTTKAMRIPNDVIDAVEKAIIKKNCNFTEYTIAALRYTLQDIDEDEPPSE